MTTEDEKIILERYITSLRSFIAELEVELGEEGGTYSSTLASAQQILQDAIDSLERQISGAA